MGDADVAQNLPDDEEEAVLRDALEDLDNEMDRIFTFMNLLHTRTRYAMSEVAYCQKFQQCVTALNLLVVPTVLAIMTVYAAAGLEVTRSVQAGLETLIKILVSISVGLGLPFYIFTLWTLFFKEDEINDGLAVRGAGHVSNSEFENDVALDAIQESLHTIGQFRALSRAFDRINDLDSDSESEESKDDQVQEDSLPEDSEEFIPEMPTVRNNKEVRLAFQRILDLDYSPADTGSDLHRKDHHELFTLGDSMENLPAKDKAADAEKCKRRSGLRTIVIQKDRNTMKTPYIETSFGM